MSHVVFKGAERIAAGSSLDVALAALRLAGDPSGALVLIFDPEGRQVDFDLSGGPADLTVRLEPAEEAPPRGRGRPKLGVTPREVTLLPRHWDWLAGQPGGASVALRKLVEAALREAEGPDRVRKGREAAYRFMTAVAGDLPGYEEATRMLFAGDWTAFDAAVEGWPEGVRETARGMAAGAWWNGAG